MNFSRPVHKNDSVIRFSSRKPNVDNGHQLVHRNLDKIYTNKDNVVLARINVSKKTNAVYRDDTSFIRNGSKN